MLSLSVLQLVPVDCFGFELFKDCHIITRTAKTVSIIFFLVKLQFLSECFLVSVVFLNLLFDTFVIRR